MLRSFTNGVRLARHTSAMFMRRPVLLVPPVIGGVALIVALAGFVYVEYHATQQNPSLLQNAFEPSVWAQVSIVTYLLLAYLGALVTAAVTYGALADSRGQEVTLRACLLTAWRLKFWLIPVALVNATVGWLLRIAERWVNDREQLRLRFLGRIGLRVAGAAWTATSMLIIPAMVAEQVGPTDAMRRAGALVRFRWGPSAIGSLLIPLVALAAAIGVGVPMTAFAAMAGTAAGVISAVAVLGLWLLARTTLAGILGASVYLYAKTGRVPGDGTPAVAELVEPGPTARSS
jgi:hypothetical protein